MSKIKDFLMLKTQHARATVLVCGLPSIVLAFAAGFDGGFLAGIIYGGLAFITLVVLDGLLRIGMMWVDNGN